MEEFDTQSNPRIEHAKELDDEVSLYNKERWAKLVKGNALFTRPQLDFDQESARKSLDPKGRLDKIKDKDVLCLASGGGQQSAAFGVLGANVTVFDLSKGQLKQDIKAAKHYGYGLRTVQGDMRDLSYFDESSFDIVWHPYSLNFVPDARVVFKEVKRVLRSGGLYYLMCANPFVWGMSENGWNGEGYTMKHPYLDGVKLTYEDQKWVFRGNPPESKVQGPREYRQTLSRLINGLIAQKFIIMEVEEVMSDTAFEEKEPPGSWGHFTTVAPPWIKIWSHYRPDVFNEK